MSEFLYLVLNGAALHLSKRVRAAWNELLHTKKSLF